MSKVLHFEGPRNPLKIRELTDKQLVLGVVRAFEKFGEERPYEWLSDYVGDGERRIVQRMTGRNPVNRRWAKRKDRWLGEHQRARLEFFAIQMTRGCVRARAHQDGVDFSIREPVL